MEGSGLTPRLEWARARKAAQPGGLGFRKGGKSQQGLENKLGSREIVISAGLTWWARNRSSSDPGSQLLILHDSRGSQTSPTPIPALGWDAHPPRPRRWVLGLGVAEPRAEAQGRWGSQSSLCAHSRGSGNALGLRIMQNESYH